MLLSLNPFVPNAPFRFSCFQGVEKGCVGNELVNVFWESCEFVGAKEQIPHSKFCNETTEVNKIESTLFQNGILECFIWNHLVFCKLQFVKSIFLKFKVIGFQFSSSRTPLYGFPFDFWKILRLPIHKTLVTR